MTERVYPKHQRHTGFLLRVHGVTLHDKVHSCEINITLNAEPLVLRIEISQLRWFSHVSRMSRNCLLRQVLLDTLKGKWP